MGVQAAARDGGLAAQSLATAHRALLQSRELQFAFDAPKVEKPPSWLTALLQALQAAAPVIKVVFWAGVALGAALILAFFARELLASRRTGKRQVPAAVDWRPDPEAARALLDDADRLAAAGRFEEAVRVLLFRSIEDLSGRRPGAVRPALTSRDIAGLQVIPERAREAFAHIAQVVERSFFGGRPVGADDFARCRGDYEAFAFADGWA